MTSWVIWAVALGVAVLIGVTGTHFSVRTLRYVTAATVITALVAVTAYGQTPAGGRVPADLQAAFGFGADRLSAAFFRPLWALWSSRHAPAPGRLGWAVIAVVLLLGYRQAETWAVGRQAPQLDTSKLTDGQPSIAGDGSGRDAGLATGPTAGQRHDWLAAEVRFRLAAMDVYAPPILPGGTRSDGLASIAEASGVSGAGLAGALVRFAGALWPAPRRYELRVWVEGDPPRAGGARVTVELDEPRSGQTVASKTIAAETIDEAASMVAGYVARQIFARDPASAAWCYGASDGRDLGALLLARQERVYVESTDDVRASRARQIELLWSVTGADRCAGVVRHELASLEDLERENLIALRLHALNREQYPRFFRGTYRLCMSLEMIADPGYTFFNPAAARVILDDTLDILYRAGRTAVDRCGDGDIHPRTGQTGPSVLSHALRATLLGSARRDLRVIRRQLSLPVVVWNTFWRREERAVWQPHWRRANRQAFRDGVCVAELVVAVKQRLNERQLAELPGQPAARGPGLATRFRQRKGLQIVAAITGDAGGVRRVLRAPPGGWPAGPQAPDGPPATAGRRAARGWVPPTRDRVRWLPWQARTASWQAAYNTACLYAALVRQGLTDEDQVVTSLRRVVLNRDSGVERPHDWISNDPDFAPLLRDDAHYKKVKAFLEAQERRDYPMRQTWTWPAEPRWLAGRYPVPPPTCRAARRHQFHKDGLFR
jgi:hypothetical protein